MLYRAWGRGSTLAGLLLGLCQPGHATTITQTDYGLEWIAVGDLNGDGHLDVVAMADDFDGDETWKIVALRGQGNGTFHPAQVRTLALDDYQHEISGFALGDTDSDGKLDAVWLDQYAPFDKIQRNPGNGDGTFDTKTGWNVAAQYPDSLVLFVRNTDNYLDAVYVTEGSSGTDSLVQRCGTSAGGFNAEMIANGGTPAFVRMDFADGDAQRDYLIVQAGVSPVIRTILGSDSCTSISSSYTDSTTGIVNEPARDMAVGDVNGDGKKDVVILTLQTHLLSHWVREKQAVTLEAAVRMLSFVPASQWGLTGRGLLREGWNADVVVFNADTVAPMMPEVDRDLPAGARRLKQKATGMRATVVNGEVVLRNNDHTGALPGQLLRGPLARR